MGFCRLIFFIYLIVIFISCQEKQNKEHTIYYERVDRVENKITNEMEVKIKKNGDTINFKYFELIDSIRGDLIVIEEENDINISSKGCNFNFYNIKLSKLSQTEIPCLFSYPFFLEEITILDRKVLNYKGNKYIFYKIGSENRNNSVTTIWLKGTGPIFIRLSSEYYYRIKSSDNLEKDKFLKEILNEIMKDLDFIELRPTPEPPSIY